MDESDVCDTTKLQVLLALHVNYRLSGFTKASPATPRRRSHTTESVPTLT